MKHVVYTVIPVLMCLSPAAAAPLPAQSPWPAASDVISVRATCKQASNCAEAVAMWCGGYSRADADRDGIPCENVCHSRAEVEAIEAEIGCSN